MDQKKIGPERAAVCPRPHREAGKSQCWAQAAPSAGGVGGEQGPPANSEQAGLLERGRPPPFHTCHNSRVPREGGRWGHGLPCLAKRDWGLEERKLWRKLGAHGEDRRGHEEQTNVQSQPLIALNSGREGDSNWAQGGGADIISILLEL